MQDAKFPEIRLPDIDDVRDRQPVEERSIAEYPPILVPDIAEIVERPKKASQSLAQEEVKKIKAELGKNGDARQLSVALDDLNSRLRELRLERKNADTWAAKIFPAARARLANLDASIDMLKTQRDENEMRMEEMLPPEARSVTRGDRIRAAQDKIVEVVGSAMAGKRERLANVPRRDVLRSNRAKLEAELSSLNFWQFGRKRKVVNEMKVIDHEMAGIINAERGR